MVRNLTIRLDDKLGEEIGKYPWVNWSVICRKAITDHIAFIQKMERHDTAIKAHSTRGTYDKRKKKE